MEDNLSKPEPMSVSTVKYYICNLLQVSPRVVKTKDDLVLHIFKNPDGWNLGLVTLSTIQQALDELRQEGLVLELGDPGLLSYFAPPFKVSSVDQNFVLDHILKAYNAGGLEAMTAIESILAKVSTSLSLNAKFKPKEQRQVYEVTDAYMSLVNKSVNFLSVQGNESKETASSLASKLSINETVNFNDYISKPDPDGESKILSEIRPDFKKLAFSVTHTEGK